MISSPQLMPNGGRVTLEGEEGTERSCMRTSVCPWIRARPPEIRDRSVSRLDG